MSQKNCFPQAAAISSTVNGKYNQNYLLSLYIYQVIETLKSVVIKPRLMLEPHIPKQCFIHQLKKMKPLFF